MGACTFASWSCNIPGREKNCSVSWRSFSKFVLFKCSIVRRFRNLSNTSFGTDRAVQRSRWPIQMWRLLVVKKNGWVNKDETLIWQLFRYYRSSLTMMATSFISNVSIFISSFFFYRRVRSNSALAYIWCSPDRTFRRTSQVYGLEQSWTL